jgi:GTP cyclohydrolase I
VTSPVLPLDAATVNGRGASRPVDLEGATAAAAQLLDALGLDTDSEHRRDTAARMARALGEMLKPPSFEPTTFDNAGGYDELVVVDRIPFFSLCEHHVLPFIGEATIAYAPKDRIVGLSKLAWVVQLYARRLQTQEAMTQQIADWLVEQLDPKGVGVRLRAEHLCMSLRGARAIGAVTDTTTNRGVLADDPVRREEWQRRLSS